jgi:hypothetical protein
MNSHLRDAFTNRLAVAEVTLCGRPDSSNDPSLGDWIAQCTKPSIELSGAKESAHAVMYPYGYAHVKAPRGNQPDLGKASFNFQVQRLNVKVGACPERTSTFLQKSAA